MKTWLPLSVAHIGSMKALSQPFPYADCDPMFCAQRRVDAARILTAAIAVMEQTFRRVPSPQDHVEGSFHQPSVTG